MHTPLLDGQERFKTGMRDLTIAIAVFNARVGRTRDNLDKTLRFTEQAAAEGADLICFPEMNITGYSNHPDILHHAESIPGPSTDRLLEMSRQRNVLILAGLAEKDGQGRLFASHAVIAPGGLMGVYRKLYIAPPERNLYTAGAKIPVFEYNGVTFGLQLCYDAHFPELSTRMAGMGATVLFIPHASPRGKAVDKHQSWLRHLPARAYDNSLFVVACNQTGSNAKGLTFPGNAMVLGPAGRILEQWVSGEEALHVCRLDAEELLQVRGNRMHFFLPNRRPELYT